VDADAGLLASIQELLTFLENRPGDPIARLAVMLGEFVGFAAA